MIAALGRLASAANLATKPDQQHQRAIGAKPAVAHDRKFFVAVATAAKAVSDVGQTVLVQRAGQGRAGAERQRGRGQFGNANREQTTIDQSDGEADHRAHQRERALRARHAIGHRIIRVADRYPRQQRNRETDIAGSSP